MDIVERHGSGGTSCRGHGEKVVLWCGGREERKTQVGWGDLEGECVPRLFIHGQNYATAGQRSTKRTVLEGSNCILCWFTDE